MPNKPITGNSFLSCAKARDMCVSTVRLLMPRRLAMSALDIPSSRLIRKMRRRCSGIEAISLITILYSSP